MFYFVSIVYISLHVSLGQKLLFPNRSLFSLIVTHIFSLIAEIKNENVLLISRIIFLYSLFPLHSDEVVLQSHDLRRQVLFVSERYFD